MNRHCNDTGTVEKITEGPLGPHMVAYAEHLCAEGYAKESATRMLRIVAGFSRWLKRRRIAVARIILQHVRHYLRSRKGSGYQPHRCDQAALSRLLTLLAERGAISAPRPKRLPTPSEELLQQYDAYLDKERGLTWRTRIDYAPFVRQFLTDQFGRGPASLAKLRPADIIRFVQRRAVKLKPKYAQSLISALRSFLRFARYRGQLTSDLAAHVPKVAGWSLSTVPKSIPPIQVEQVLSGCDRNTAMGRRDYAILLLLARLGLRGREVAHLTLDDVDWENGCLTIHGKGGRIDQLPLVADVGKAIAAYVKNGRPRRSNDRHLFLRTRAPITGFKDHQAVGSLVKHALARAGIDSPQKGAHQFRHALASAMLRRGRSLVEIGEILRHRSPNTTALYAKVDLVSLRALALPWPGGGR
jgi:integrase/recombinase XerD